MHIFDVIVDILEFLVELMFGGLWFWGGVGLGIAGAWVVWTYLPASVNRASLGAIVFLAGCVLGGVLATIDEKRK